MLGRIAVHLSADENCKRRIDVAIKLAKEHQAEIVGVYPVDITVPQTFSGTALPSEVTKMIRERLKEGQLQTKKLFEEATSAAGVTGHWRTPKGAIEDVLAQHARYARLLIMSKAEDPQSTASPITANVPEAVIMAAGRPVLMVPTVGTMNTIGERVLFCWDKKREAARAFADAAPLLRTAKELVVLAVDEDTESLHEQDIQDNDFSDLCTALGYPTPKVLLRSSKNVGVGNVILNTATDYGSDLIVMGAYGHSRMRQWIMGGASKTLLNSMTVPVLLSH